MRDRAAVVTNSRHLSLPLGVVLLPPRIIEYVVAHEFVHLRHTRHDERFWTTLARCMLDFKTTKDLLAESGGRLI
jgi:hypothetical protein